MGARSRILVGVLVLGVLFVGAFVVRAKVFPSASSAPDAYESPATRAFVALGAPRPTFACDEGMLLGGGRVGAVVGVDPSSSDAELVAAVESSFGGERVARSFRGLKVWRSTDSLKVLTAGDEGAVTAAVVVGPPGVSSVPDVTGNATLLTHALAFCS